MIWASNGYEVSDEPARLDLDAVHAYLATSYWSPGLPRDVMERGIRHSICLGLYTSAGSQVGFARVVTDRAQFSYLADVYVLEGHRGRGLGVWLVKCVMQHPELQSMRRWILATRDAHQLYSRFGFGPPAHPERMMQIDRSPSEVWPEGAGSGQAAEAET